MAQKTKIKWSVEGDENSRFFHGMLNKKRSQLNIRGVMVDGVWTEKPSYVKREFFQHFRSRFDRPKESRAYVDMCYSICLSIEQHEDLEHYVSKEELKRAMWDCDTDKSPGPDGFTFGFYRHFWSTIENDVFVAVNHFLTYGDIPKGCNSSFIALIPKVPDANLVKDFRPISLIGSIYKIIAKILANRIVGVLGDIVNEKKQSLIFKVDFEKAYDSVRWDFLDDILKKFGFGNKWCAWIQSCLRSSRGSILINGSPTEEFQFFKGLKQGDPLSLFLFILIMESLHLSFQRVVDAGMFMGIKLSPSLNLSHMFYVNYAVFVGQWCDGTKVGGSMSRVQAWKEVVDKVESRLSKWKMKTLSIGGSNKATWVKWNSVLASKEKRGLGKTSLWAKVIKAIHGDDGKVGNDTNTGVWSCWTNIVNEIKILRRQGVNVLDFMLLKLGNGDMTAFWDDNWIGGGVLKDLYPRIYALETCKTVNVSTKLNNSSLDNSFRRRTRGGVEHAQYDALSDLLNAVTLVPMVDRRVWSLESSDEFSVASIRKVIDEKRLSIVNSMTRWVKYVPIKVNVLAWKVKIDALLTRLDISCCSLARQIARKISLWWNVNYVDVNSYVEWLNWLVSLRLTAKLKVMIEGVFYAMWWYLWSYRNRLLFETKVPLKAVIFDDVVSSSFYWCSSNVYGDVPHRILLDTDVDTDDFFAILYLLKLNRSEFSLE
nr:hypothetical protein [Tanacetum cinerariifolium]